MGTEDEEAFNQREDDLSASSHGNSRNGCEDEMGATISCSDVVFDETRTIFDMNNPVMKPCSLYATMDQFRLEIKQNTIIKEFELGIEATNKTRFRGYCKGPNCPWSIHARPETKGSPTIQVMAFIVFVLNISFVICLGLNKNFFL